MKHRPIAVAIAAAAVGFSCGRDDETVPTESPVPAEYTWVDLSETQPESQPSLRVVDTRPAKTRITTAPSTRAAQPIHTAEEVPTFTPLINAAANEWVRYAAMDERILEYRVLSVEHSKITTQVRVYEQGYPLGQAALRVDARDGDPVADLAQRVGAQRTARETSIHTAGRTLSAICYEDRWIDEEVPYVRRTWVSPKVPVFGTIRMELYGADLLEARLELVDFGNQ